MKTSVIVSRLLEQDVDWTDDAFDADVQLDVSLVQAVVYADGGSGSCRFECSKWFEFASDERILDLAAEDFCKSYVADDVARSTNIPELRRFLKDLYRHCIGYEVYIDAEDAMAWIRKNRPNIADTAEGLR